MKWLWISSFGSPLLIAAAIVAASPSLAADRDVVQLRGSIAKASTLELDRLTVKLYPPKETNHPVLIGSVGRDGDFGFKGLPPDRYLLEVSNGIQPLYQEIYEIRANVHACQIQLGVRSKGNRILVTQRVVLTKDHFVPLESEFNSRVAVVVEEIEGDREFRVMILESRGSWPAGEHVTFPLLKGQYRSPALFDGAFIPPKAEICFRFENRTYWLRGKVDPPRPGEKSYLEFDVFRE